MFREVCKRAHSAPFRVILVFHKQYFFVRKSYLYFLFLSIFAAPLNLGVWAYLLHKNALPTIPNNTQNGASQVKKFL